MKSSTHSALALTLGASCSLSAVTLAAPVPVVSPSAKHTLLAHNGEVHPEKSHLASANSMAGMDHGAMAMPEIKTPTTDSTHALLKLPPNLPVWLGSNTNNEVFYKRGAYNFAIYDIPALARDMNGVAVGHALAYEALVTGRERTLETTVFNQINHVLNNPPKLMPTERTLSPTFGQKYGTLELVFDWTHISHAQTIDNLVSTYADNATKDKETSLLWDYYKKEGAPFLITSLPMNMAWLDSQPYSGAFRIKYPKVNALFWGYHWLQTSVYDGLRGKTQGEQRKVYEIMGKRYHDVELYNTKRPFMPMMGETSPVFSAKYPDIANGFDNLHMLHDMINDILSTDWMTENQRQEQIKRAIFIMSPDAHKDCKAGEDRGVIDGVSHDHRFMEGMPGMGLMRNGTENHDSTAVMKHSSGHMGSMDHGAMKMDGQMGTANTPGNKTGESQTTFNPTELMWMPKMGWMSMSQCHHCSMPLPGKGGDSSRAWQASTVSAEGWTMRVRCTLCARDMSAETKGAAILTLATEDPHRPVVVFSDDEGNLTTFAKGVVFLEEKAGHLRCSQWSQAFTSQTAFDVYAAKNPKFKGVKSLSFEQWATVEADETPETYVKEAGPVENPYAADLKKRGIEAEEANSP